MTGILNEPIVPNRALEQLGLDAYSSGVAGGTAFGAGYALNPATLLEHARQRSQPYATAYEQGLKQILGEDYNPGPTLGGQPAPEPVTVLSAADATAKYGIKDELSFDRPTPEPVAAQLKALKTEELQRRGILMRARQDWLAGAVRLGSGFLASALDPINVASAFIPVVGETRYALWAAKFGTPAARLARGALEGGIGAAAVEPFVYLGAQSDRADYGAADSLLNIAFGAGLGGGLHLAGGWLADRLAGRALPPLAEAVERAPPAAREAALRGAVAAVAEGRPVRVAEALPEIDPALAEFDRLFAGETKAVRPDDLTAPGGLLAAPQARPFELGPATGDGAAARHAAYAPVAAADRPWLQGVAAEVAAADTAKVTPKMTEADMALGVAGRLYGGDVAVAPGTFPRWFTEMNAAGQKVTREKVAAVTAKLLAGEPLGVHEGRIAQAMMAEARGRREENVRQMVAHRRAREDARLQEAQRAAADETPWALPEDRQAAVAIDERVQPSLRQPEAQAAAGDAQALEQQIAELQARAGEATPAAKAYVGEADDLLAAAEAKARINDAAAACLTGVA